MSKGLDSNKSWFSLDVPSHPVVISTRVRLVRNIAGHSFSERLTVEEEPLLRRSIEAALEKTSFTPQKKLNLKDFSPLLQRLASERLLLAPGRLQKRKGYLWLDENERATAFVGGEDHLALAVFSPGFAVKAVSDQILKWEGELARSLEFAANSEWGYLSARPKNSGSGLKLSLLVNLGAVVRTGILEQVLRTSESLGFSLHPFWVGEKGESDVHLLSGQFSCGLVTDNQIALLEDLAQKIVHLEMQARRLEQEKNRWQWEDRCGRAWGILTNARRLSWEETLFHLSSLRHAGELAIMKGVTVSLLDRLLFSLQSAHLQSAYPDWKDEEDVLRAKIVREKLTGS